MTGSNVTLFVCFLIFFSAISDPVSSIHCRVCKNEKVNFRFHNIFPNVIEFDIIPACENRYEDIKSRSKINVESASCAVLTIWDKETNIIGQVGYYKFDDKNEDEIGKAVQSIETVNHEIYFKVDTCNTDFCNSDLYFGGPILTLKDKGSKDRYFFVECLKDTAFGGTRDLNVYILNNDGSLGKKLLNYGSSQTQQSLYVGRPDDQPFVRLICQVPYDGRILKSNVLVFRTLRGSSTTATTPSSQTTVAANLPKLTLQDKGSKDHYFFVECLKDTAFGGSIDLNVYILNNDGSLGKKLDNYGSSQTKQSLYLSRAADQPFVRLICQVPYNGRILKSNVLVFGTPPGSSTTTATPSSETTDAPSSTTGSTDAANLPKLMLKDTGSKNSYFYVECLKDTAFGGSKDLEVYILNNDGSLGKKLKNFGWLQTEQGLYLARDADQTFVRLVCQVPYKGTILKSNVLVFGTPPGSKSIAGFSTNTAKPFFETTDAPSSTTGTTDAASLPKLTLQDNDSKDRYFFVKCLKDTAFGGVRDLEVYILNNDGSLGKKLDNYGSLQKEQSFYLARAADQPFVRLICLVLNNRRIFKSNVLVFERPPSSSTTTTTPSSETSDAPSSTTGSTDAANLPKLTLKDYGSRDRYFYVECLKDTAFGRNKDLEVYILNNDGSLGKKLRNFHRSLTGLGSYMATPRTADQTFVRLICQVPYKGTILKSNVLVFGTPPETTSKTTDVQSSTTETTDVQSSTTETTDVPSSTTETTYVPSSTTETTDVPSSTTETTNLPKLTLQDKSSKNNYFFVECLKDTEFGGYKDLEVYILNNDDSLGKKLINYGARLTEQEFYLPRAADQPFVRLVCQVPYNGRILKSNVLVFGTPPDTTSATTTETPDVQSSTTKNNLPIQNESNLSSILRMFGLRKPNIVICKKATSKTTDVPSSTTKTTDVHNLPKLTLKDRGSKDRYFFVECLKDTAFGRSRDLEVYILNNDGSLGKKLRNYGGLLTEQINSMRKFRSQSYRLICQVPYGGRILKSNVLVLGAAKVEEEQLIIL